MKKHARTECASNLLLNLVGYKLEVGKNARGMIYVAYENSWIKNGAFLSGGYGEGSTFDEACENYLSVISGKTLVFGAFSDHRQEIRVL